MPNTIASEYFRQLLRNELLRRTKTNPAYSIRAFAKQLEIDHSSLAKILKGHLPVGDRVISRLGKKLGYSKEEMKQFTDQDYLENNQNYLSITADHFAVINDWYHYAILCLTELPNFKPSTSWVAKSLSISASEAKAAIQRLKKLGLLKVNKDGSWSDTTGGWSTNLTTSQTSRAQRLHQRQVLELAIRALEETDPELRSQTSMTLTVDPTKLTKAKTLIGKFRRQMTELLNSKTSGTEVYHLSISLYPLTQFFQFKGGKK